MFAGIDEWCAKINRVTFMPGSLLIPKTEGKLGGNTYFRLYVKVD